MFNDILRYIRYFIFKKKFNISYRDKTYYFKKSWIWNILTQNVLIMRLWLNIKFVLKVTNIIFIKY